MAALAREKPGELLDRVFAAFQDYKAKYKHDLVLIGGTHEGYLLPCVLVHARPHDNLPAATAALLTKECCCLTGDIDKAFVR